MAKRKGKVPASIQHTVSKMPAGKHRAQVMDMCQKNHANCGAMDFPVRSPIPPGSG